LAKTLTQLGKDEEARLHEKFISSLKNKEVNKEAENTLRKIWNTLKYNSQPQYSGFIKSILPNGKAGFVATAKGKSYYFSIREFRAKREKLQVGQPVTFFLEEGYDAKKGKSAMNAVKIELSK